MLHMQVHELGRHHAVVQIGHDAQRPGHHDKDEDQLTRFHELRAEHMNIRAALGYALGAPGTPGDAPLAAHGVIAPSLRPPTPIPVRIKVAKCSAE